VRILNILFLTAIVVSCTEDESTDCIEASLNNWESEMFKTDYSIKFPDNYAGQGMIGFEGNTFHKVRNDSLVTFFYSYCSAVYCEDFGDTLSDPIPEELIVYNDKGVRYDLTNQVIFCNDNDDNGVLYFDENDDSFGMYYMYVNDMYLEAVSVLFDSESANEIKEILGTISFATTIHN